MKNILFIILFLFTLNCSINKVSKTHGFRFVEAKYEEIILNKTNKNDLKNIIGPPSSKSIFDDVWFYIERKKRSQSIFKLGKKKIVNKLNRKKKNIYFKIHDQKKNRTLMNLRTSSSTSSRNTVVSSPQPRVMMPPKPFTPPNSSHHL